MQYRLVDMLACPVDNHFPLKLEVDGTVGGQTPPHSWRACQRHCSLTGGVPDDTRSCEECLQMAVVSGYLECPNCGRRYEVQDGIAVLLPPDLVDEPAAPESRDQRQEMLARDFQAPYYDRFLMLRLLSLFERPAVMRTIGRFPGENIVELGCGTGRFTTKLAKESMNVVAVDFSLESLRLCRQKLERQNHIDYVQADVSRLPFREGVFDKALSCQVFEHIPSPRLRSRAVTEAARVLAPGGGLVMTVYRQFWFSGVFGPKEGYHHGGIYYNRFTPAEFKSLIDAEFDLEVYHPNLGNYIQLASCRKRS